MNDLIIFGTGGHAKAIIDIVESLEYQSIPEWDSVGHMVLMSTLEEKFDIMLDMDDIIDFSGFERGKEILLKYDVKI